MFAFPILLYCGELSTCASGPVTIQFHGLPLMRDDLKPSVSSDWERISLQGPVICEGSMSSSPFGLPAALGKKSLGMGEIS